MPWEHTNSGRLRSQIFTAPIPSRYQIQQAELERSNPTTKAIDSSVSLFFLWTTIFSIIILALVKILYKLEVLKTYNLSVFSHSHIPCQKCIFFNDNIHLKCAVHPHSAFTKQAIDCSDYRNLDENYTFNNITSQAKTMVNQNEPRGYS